MRPKSIGRQPPNSPFSWRPPSGSLASVHSSFLRLVGVMPCPCLTPSRIAEKPANLAKRPGGKASIIRSRGAQVSPGTSACTRHTRYFPRKEQEGTNHHVPSNRHLEFLLAGPLLSAHRAGPATAITRPRGGL